MKGKNREEKEFEKGRGSYLPLDLGGGDLKGFQSFVLISCMLLYVPTPPSIHHTQDVVCVRASTDYISRKTRASHFPCRAHESIDHTEKSKITPNIHAR